MQCELKISLTIRAKKEHAHTHNLQYDTSNVAKTSLKCIQQEQQQQKLKK